MRFSKPIVTRALLTLLHAIFTVGPVVGEATDEAGWTRDRSFTPAIVRHRSSLEFNTMDDIKLPGVTGDFDTQDHRLSKLGILADSAASHWSAS